VRYAIDVDTACDQNAGVDFRIWRTAENAPFSRGTDPNKLDRLAREWLSAGEWEMNMRPETQSRLDEIFEQSERQDVAAARAKSERDRTEEAALAKFKTLREKLIKPTMQSFAHYLASKGHNANVVENEERFEGGPTGVRLMEEASIELRISPQGADQYAQYTKGPHFLVSLDRAKSKVCFHECTTWGQYGGRSGSCGELSLDSLNEQMLEEAITKTIGSIFIMPA